jgi:hypothetical protein
MLIQLLLAGFVLTRNISETQVTIGPAVLTFPEIARELHRTGNSIECSPALKNRAAFVYLKNRSWKEARALLSKGLDLRFRQIGGLPDTWKMEPDPVVVEREQTWVASLIRNVQSRFHWSLRNIRPYLKYSYQQVKERYDAAWAELKVHFANDPNFDPDSSPRTRELAEIMNTSIGATDVGWWLTARWLESGVLRLQAMEESVRRGHSFQIQRINSDEELDGVRFAALSSHFSEMHSSPNLAIYGFELDPRDLKIRTEIFTMNGDGEVMSTNGYETSPYGTARWGVLFKGHHKEGQEPSPGIGTDEASAWIDAQHKLTQDYLASPLASKPVKNITEEEITSVSQVIEEWSRTLDQEAIMELSPLREELEDTNHHIRTIPPGAAVTLAELFSEPDQPSMFTEGTSLQVWTLMEKDHALLVSNRIAFMDRLRDLPSAPFVELERSLASKAKPYENRFPQMDYDKLVAYCKATTPQQNALWRVIGMYGLYRGVNVINLCSDYAMANLWEGLSQSDRDKAVTLSSPPQRLTVSLSHMSLKTQQRLVATLQGFGSTYIQSWNPKYAGYLRTCSLYVGLNRNSVKDGRASFIIDLVASDKKQGPDISLSGELRNIPVIVSPR